MTFKERMSEITQSIRAAAVSSPSVFFFVLAAGISQLFYKYIPNAIHLNFLFSFSVVLLCNDKIKAATARTKLTIFFLFRCCFSELSTAYCLSPSF